MHPDAGIFRLLGALALGYACYAMFTGNIATRWLGLNCTRDEQPLTFWFIALSWLALGVVVFFMPKIRHHLGR